MSEINRSELVEFRQHGKVQFATRDGILLDADFSPRPLGVGNNSKMRETAKMLGIKQTKVVNFDLPAGFSCPAASLCQAYAARSNGKITRGKHAEFLCFAAKLEGAFPSSRRLHWHNFRLIESAFKRDGQRGVYNLLRAMVEELSRNGVKVVRIHSSGDFYRPEYFKAWAQVAAEFPEISFFAYTKMLPLMSEYRPSNFGMVYSYGSTFDNQWNESIPTCFVITGADNQYGDIKITCTEENPANDFYEVMAGRTFGIRVH